MKKNCLLNGDPMIPEYDQWCSPEPIRQLKKGFRCQKVTIKDTSLHDDAWNCCTKGCRCQRYHYAYLDYIKHIRVSAVTLVKPCVCLLGLF
uniref:Uncharacterized protein n=1 Tax=Setaria italica TaxID=4555 RepID=K4AH87_SETIT